ncbi:hypothetical protein SAMN04487936_107110 [Halobacillus dabanensis]|uniref:Uncharacterized protein n=1 Tax=Halobacillus dabanensis TaxID=240302 RepID=A0A1I3WUJ9_HALDA|nr:hypothetical protein SAMN04487936_107110 [Halobacillus dabanensis]
MNEIHLHYLPYQVIHILDDLVRYFLGVEVEFCLVCGGSI